MKLKEREQLRKMASQLEMKEDVKGLRNVHIRIKLGMIMIDDVAQQYRPDVDIYFYYHANDDDKAGPDWETKIANFSNFRGEYQNIDKNESGEWPVWVPHFDFGSEVEEAMITDESFWINREGVIFGRKNWIPKLQNRFNTTAFPFDRQILNIELLSNNCLFQQWSRHNDCPKQQSLFYDLWHIQGELDALADVWDLDRVRMNVNIDVDDVSSQANLLMYIARKPNYYAINISTMLFFIIFLQIYLPFFPYDESRFDFALQLVLTQVAYRFITQTMLPQTGYLMYLDKYMLAGFGILILRFFFDALLILCFEVPEAGPGDDFRCGWKLYRNTIQKKLILSSWGSEEADNCSTATEESSTSCADLPQLPTICKVDMIVTVCIIGAWVLLWTLFLIPKLFQRSWKQVEESIEEEKLVDTLNFEYGEWIVPPPSELSLGAWLQKHSDRTSVEKLNDIIEDEKVPLPKSINNTESRNTKEWRGWTEPPHTDDTNNSSWGTKQQQQQEQKQEEYASVEFTTDGYNC